MINWQELEEKIKLAYSSNVYLRENKAYFLEASEFCLNKKFRENEQKCNSCQNNLFRLLKNQVEIEKKKPIVGPIEVIEELIEEEPIEEEVFEPLEETQTIKKTKKKK